MSHTFITYHSTNAPADEAWIAYINGWKVKFTGNTEQEAKDKAEALWTSERARMAEAASTGDWANWSNDTPKEGRGHANTGKVWMHHGEKGFARVPLTEIAMYEQNGYVRRGPRSAVTQE